MQALWMFPALFLAIFSGFPVAFAMIVVAVLFGLLAFGDSVLFQFVAKLEEIATANVLAAVPLFIFMGAIFEHSGIASRLFDAIHQWMRRIPGGLAVSTVLMCVVFAAASGIIGATETVVGMLSIPAMMRRSYDKSLIAGTICAGGSLGTIIPPSVLAVVIGPVASVSVGDVLVGMLLPGLLLAGLYIVYIIGLCTLRPEYGPRTEAEGEGLGFVQKVISTAWVLLPPLLVIVTVLGSILAGIATPTEAAATGAFGTLILSALYGRLTVPMVGGALLRTANVTAMILTVLLGGSLFAGVFVGFGGLRAVTELLAAANLGPWSGLTIVVALAFVAGFMLDPLVVILIVVPLAAPLMQSFGFDLVWFCVVFLMILQTAYITPPMAPSIFYLRGISPPEMTLSHMYRGITPFIAVQLVATTLVMAYPQMVLWLPKLLLGNP